MQAAITKKTPNTIISCESLVLSFFVLYFLLKIIHCSCLPLILSPPLNFFISHWTCPCCQFLLSHTFHLSTFPTSSNHATFCASNSRFLFSVRSLFLLASIQRVKVEEEIDSKKDSHVMWRGTKEDPGGLGRLSATRFIPRPPATTPQPPFSPLLHTPPENNTWTLHMYT